MNSNDLRAKGLLAGREQAPCMQDHEIAAAMGITRSRVYQIRLAAIAKIRRAVMRDPALRRLVSAVCGREV